MQSLSPHEDHIVQLLDFYEEEQFFYLVMDLMKGGDVFDRVLEIGKYSEGDARKLTMSLLKGVHCMHNSEVAHRDLKPQNVVLCDAEVPSPPEALPFSPKVCDFGLARARESSVLATAVAGSSSATFGPSARVVSGSAGVHAMVGLPAQCLSVVFAHRRCAL